jgi:hypothetical protein
MKNIQIREVESKRDWSAFLRLPWKIFKNDHYWVPPLLADQKKNLDRKKNPFFKHAYYKAWIVTYDGETAGRILAFVDKAYCDLYKEDAGFIGYFESINDQSVADLLFTTALHWLKANGMRKVYGPMNFSIANECGVLMSGYNYSPVIQMNHTPPYYIDLFANAGFTKAHDLYAYLMTEEMVRKNDTMMAKLKRISEHTLQKEHITIRTVNMKDYDNELQRVNGLFNDFMKNTWGFVPSTLEEVAFSGESLKTFADPEMIFFAEVNKQVVGCSLAIPDINEVLKRMNGDLYPWGIFKFLWYKRKVRSIRLLLLGVTEPYRNKGLDIIFYYYTISRGMARGYNKCESSWVSEDNTVLNSIMDKIGSEKYKTYRMFGKEI